MIGQEFIRKLEREIIKDGKWDKLYTPADLTRHTATLDFWNGAILRHKDTQEEDVTARENVQSRR